MHISPRMVQQLLVHALNIYATLLIKVTALMYSSCKFKFLCVRQLVVQYKLCTYDTVLQSQCLSIVDCRAIHYEP